MGELHRQMQPFYEMYLNADPRLLSNKDFSLFPFVETLSEQDADFAHWAKSYDLTDITETWADYLRRENRDIFRYQRLIRTLLEGGYDTDWQKLSEQLKEDLHEVEVYSERKTADMLGRQIDLLNGIPLDVLRNNSNKLVNQDMDVMPLENINRSAENALHQVAGNIHDSSLMKRYIEELTKKDREKWQLSEVNKAMMTGGDKACEYIEKKADSHLSQLTSRMEWFPVVYHLLDKVALVVFTVLGYYTGKYHLSDTMAFLWLMAGMPVLIVSVIWAINEVWAWMERRKKKPN